MDFSKVDMHHVRNKKSLIFADTQKLGRISNVMSTFIVYCFRLYKRRVSPYLEFIFGHACRFTPTCSEYTIGAIERFGVVKGFWLGLKRLSSCHPFGRSGYDPVPNLSK